MRTSVQIELLAAVEQGPQYIRGPQVRSAHALQARGLVVLEDDGALGRDVRERWTLKITDAGRAELKALRRMRPERLKRAGVT